MYFVCLRHSALSLSFWISQLVLKPRAGQRPVCYSVPRKMYVSAKGHPHVLMKCLSPECFYRQHQDRAAIPGYCCKKCTETEGKGHGKRCEGQIVEYLRLNQLKPPEPSEPPPKRLLMEADAAAAEPSEPPPKRLLMEATPKSAAKSARHG